jgi:hypothetical protein
MPPKQAEKKVLIKSDKLTQGEKKQLKNANKAKANPEKAAAKKEKNDATRARRYVSICCFVEFCRSMYCRSMYCRVLLLSSIVELYHRVVLRDYS